MSHIRESVTALVLADTTGDDVDADDDAAEVAETNGIAAIKISETIRPRKQ